MIFIIAINLFIIIPLLVVLKKQIKQIKKSFFSKFKEADGVVVDIKEFRGSDSTTYSSIIEFQVNGQPYRYVEKVSNSSTEKIGKKIKIKYNPYDPTDCVKKYCFDYIDVIIILIVFLIVVNLSF